jgi:glycosyltransferase involved in cell wall biosynthesis
MSRVNNNEGFSCDRGYVKDMNILFYMLHNSITGTEKSHIFEVMNNIVGLGNTVRYANGEIYVPIDPSELGFRQVKGRRLSRLERMKRWLLTRPLGGEGMLIRLFFSEAKLFFLSVVVVLRYRPDVIYRRHSPIFDSSYVLAEILGIPTVKEVNGIIVDEYTAKKLVKGLTLRLVDIMERFNFRRTKKIIVVTPKLKEVLRLDYGIPAAKIDVVPNGANTDLFSPEDSNFARKRLGLDPTARYLCFSGALVIWQSLGCLIESLPMILESFPGTRILFVGDGLLKGELIELAEQTGVSEYVEFTGMVPYHEVATYINASDICLLPAARSYRNERIGSSALKLGEYLACGKPVIASRLAGFEILEEVQAGILVDPDSPEDVAAAVVRLLENPEQRLQMGANGREYVITHQSWKRVAERIVGICGTLVKAREM